MAPKGRQSVRETSRPFELVHADLIGPFPPSLGGTKFALVIVDDYVYTFFILFYTEVKNRGLPDI